MQGLSAKVPQRLLRRRAEQRRLGQEAGAIDLVAEQRVADRGEMDADLVGTPGFEPAFEQARDRAAATLPRARAPSRQRPPTAANE